MYPARLWWPTACLMLLLTSAVSAGESLLTARLVPARRKLSVGDPLFVRVELFNRTPEALKLDRPLGSPYGTVAFEVRPKGQGPFTRVATRFEGVASPFLARLINVPPGRGMAVHECLFLSKGTPVFEAPAVHELRAVIYVENRVITSPAVELEVAPREASETELIKEASADLNLLVGADGVGAVPLERVAHLEIAVGESALRDTLRWVQAILMLRQSADAEARADARSRFDALHRGLDPVTRDIALFLLAREYMELGELSESRRLLLRQRHRTYERDVLLQAVDHRVLLGQVDGGDAQSRSKQPESQGQ